MDDIGDKYILFSLILDFGKGSKALKLSKELGAIGGTIYLGKGTVRTEWLNLLGAYDLRKEILIALIRAGQEDEFYERMEAKFNLHKPHKGIAFSMPLKYWLGQGNFEDGPKLQEKGGKGMDFESIFVIVDKGLSSQVLDAAESVGSTGGTVISGRGSGSQEKERLFNIEIEPEKDIILILAKKDKTQEIVNAIGEELGMDEPNKGIIFVMDVTRTLGLYEKSE